MHAFNQYNSKTAAYKTQNDQRGGEIDTQIGSGRGPPAAEFTSQKTSPSKYQN